MTRKEWIEKNLPAYVSNKARGGIWSSQEWIRVYLSIGHAKHVMKRALSICVKNAGIRN